MNWKKAKAKEVKAEFRGLLYSIADSNGTNELINVVEDFLTTEGKRSFVESWHEQDEEDEE